MVIIQIRRLQVRCHGCGIPHISPHNMLLGSSAIASIALLMLLGGASRGGVASGWGCLLLTKVISCSSKHHTLILWCCIMNWWQLLISHSRCRCCSRCKNIFGGGNRIIRPQISWKICRFINFWDVAADAVIQILPVLILWSRILGGLSVQRLHLETLIGQGRGVYTLKAIDCGNICPMTVIGSPLSLASR